MAWAGSSFAPAPQASLTDDEAAAESLELRAQLAAATSELEAADQERRAVSHNRNL